MKKLFALLFVLGLVITSCSPKITLTTLDGTDSRTFKYTGDVKITEEYVKFTTKKGTKQSAPKDMYNYSIK